MEVLVDPVLEALVLGLVLGGWEKGLVSWALVLKVLALVLEVWVPVLVEIWDLAPEARVTAVWVVLEWMQVQLAWVSVEEMVGLVEAQVMELVEAWIGLEVKIVEWVLPEWVAESEAVEVLRMWVEVM